MQRTIIKNNMKIANEETKDGDDLLIRFDYSVTIAVNPNAQVPELPIIQF